MIRLLSHNANMSVVENRLVTTQRGGVTGRGFQPGQSGNPGGRPKGLTRRVRELVGDDGDAIAAFMYEVMADDAARTADRLEAAKWLADRGFGRAVQAVDIDVSQHPTINLSLLSTDDVEALIAIFERYQPDAARLAESGELRLGAGPLEATGSRQR